MWLMDSSYKWRRKHLFAKDHPLLFEWSKVKTCSQVVSQVASQANQFTFGSIQEFQITPIEKKKLYFLAPKPSKGL